jgi:hypothetical protein
VAVIKSWWLAYHLPLLKIYNIIAFVDCRYKTEVWSAHLKLDVIGKFQRLNSDLAFLTILACDFCLENIVRIAQLYWIRFFFHEINSFRLADSQKLLLFIVSGISSDQKHWWDIIFLFFRVLKSNFNCNILSNSIHISRIMVNRSRNLFAVLKNQIKVCGIIRLYLVGHWYLLDFFEIKWVYHREIAFNDLFTSVPYGTACAIESDRFAFKQVHTARRTQVHKILKITIRKTHGFKFKLQPLYVFMLSQTNECIEQIHIVYLFLSLLFLSDCFNSLCFLKKMMVKVALEH